MKQIKPLYIIENSEGNEVHIAPLDKRLPDIYLHINEEKILGRSKHFSIQVDNEYVSGQHLSLFLSVNSVLSIKDLNSSNGTYVNGQKLTPNSPYTVLLGMKIVIGSEDVVYELLR